MSRDIDWSETDRLMEELRRQLGIDENGLGTERAGDAVSPEEGAAGQGTAAPVALAERPEASAEVLAPIVDEDVMTPAAGERTPASQKKKKKGKKRRPVYEAPRPRPSVIDDFADIVPISERRPDAVAVVADAADEEMRAEDVADAVVAPEADAVEAPAVEAVTPVAPEVEAEAEAEADAVEEPAVEAAVPVAPVVEAEAEAVAEAEVVEEPAVEAIAPVAPVSQPEEQPITMTRAADGQMALALPEIDRHVTEEEEEEEVDGEDIGGDEMQLDLFSAFTVDRERRRNRTPEAPHVTAVTPAERDLKQSVESSEEDFRFFLDFEYEDELGRAIGFDKIRDYHELDVNGEEVVPKRRRKRGEKREYELPRQGIHLRKQYAKQKRGYVINLVLSVVIMLFLFLYEHPRLMSELFKDSFIDSEKYPVSYILFGIQLLVLAAFFSYRRLIEGFVRLLRFSPIDSSLCSVLFIITFLYHLVQLFLPHAGYPVLYLSPAAASRALLSFADLLDWYRESLAFQVVSSGKQKYALVPRVSVGGRQNDARARLLESEQDERVLYVRPVGFVRNYFANTAKRAEHQKSLGWQLLLIAAVGVALGLYTFFRGGSAEEMWQTVFLTFLLCLPVTSLLVTALPMFFASRLRLQKKSAIIGEEQIYQCGEQTALVLPDTEAFGAMHNERFELIDGCDEHRVSVLVKALLAAVGSPLADSVNVEEMPMDITLTEIDEHGIAALVGKEKTPVLFGSVEYLQRYGIRVQPRGTDLDDVCRRLLGVVIDRKLSALFLARYRLTGDMLELLEQLSAEDVRVMIRTKDPGVHNDLMNRLLSQRGATVRVMKPTVREVDIRTDRVDATVVSVGSPIEAARAFVTCRAIRRAGNFGKALQALSVIIGAGFAGLLTFFRLSATVSPLLVTLYMLSWCALHGVVSFFRLREREHE